jgi:ABC-type sugar transport system substrate-binding protein
MTRTRLSLSTVVLLTASALVGACSMGDQGGASGGNAGARSENTAAAPAVPASVAVTGGEFVLPKPADPGISAIFGPLCKASNYNGGVPAIDFKRDKIAFVQSESDIAAYRVASTKSMKDEAARRGWNLLYANPDNDAPRQNALIKQMIDQGAKAVIFSPVSSMGMTDALGYAKRHNVPVIAVDRSLTGVKACSDVAAQLGSDFIEEGRRAARAIIKATNGKAKLAILFGTAGVNVTDDRTRGFVDEIVANAPGIEIVDQRTARFDRDTGERVFADMLRAHPDIDALYAENDEMGVGALRVLKRAGKAGRDKTRVVTIDGTQDGVQAIIDGYFSAVIECNPRYGAPAFNALEAFFGQGAPAVTFTTDRDYDPSNAAAKVSQSY